MTDRILDACRLLIVEDEYMIAAEVEGALQDAGACVIGPLAVLEEGIRCVQRDEIDAVVLNVKLQGKDAYPLADLLMSRRIPFVFLTGYECDEVPSRFAHVPCFEKPHDTRALTAVLQRLCEEQHRATVLAGGDPN